MLRRVEIAIHSYTQFWQVNASLDFHSGWRETYGLVVEATPETTAPACPPVGFDTDL